MLTVDMLARALLEFSANVSKSFEYVSYAIEELGTEIDKNGMMVNKLLEMMNAVNSQLTLISYVTLANFILVTGVITYLTFKKNK